MRVLCYSPYAFWNLHMVWEATLAAALRVDGAEVHYITCDGAFPVCDLDSVNTPRDGSTCANCQSNQASAMARFPMLPFKWLGHYLNPSDYPEVMSWAGALPVSGLLDAQFDGQRVADWVGTSLCRNFRVNSFDFNDPRIVQLFRVHLCTVALAFRGLTRAFDVLKPDLLIVYNGHRLSTRAALEVARGRGVRVLSHERGMRKETMTLFADDHCLYWELFRDIWRNWRNVALTSSQIDAIVGFLNDRAHGRQINWYRYSPSPEGTARFCAEAGLRPDRPIWALFTSSTDEMFGIPPYGSRGAGQEDWILDTVAYARAHPEIQLVIRVHPNSASAHYTNAWLAASNQAEQAFFSALEQDLPPNATLIDHRRPLSSYDLMEAATYVLTFNSTTGVEAAARGIKVIHTGNSRFRGLPFLDCVLTNENYRAQYDAALQMPVHTRFPERRRDALRFMYAWVYRWLLDMPLVEITDPVHGQPRYSSIDELKPGRDPGLDRFRRIVYQGEPVIPVPTGADLARTDADESLLLLA